MDIDKGNEMRMGGRGAVVDAGALGVRKASTVHSLVIVYQTHDQNAQTSSRSPLRSSLSPSAFHSSNEPVMLCPLFHLPSSPCYTTPWHRISLEQTEQPKSAWDNPSLQD